MKVIKHLGGWPVLGEKSGWSAAAPFDWLDLLIKFRKLGFSHDVLIDLSVTPDFRNNTKHIIDVSAPCPSTIFRATVCMRAAKTN